MRKHGATSTGLFMVAAGIGLWTACGDVEPLAPIRAPLPVSVPDRVTVRPAATDVDDADDGAADDGASDADDAADDPPPPPIDDACPLAFVQPPRACDASLGRWVETRSPMRDNRIAASATKLRDGRVLIVGGFPNTPDAGPALATAEVYDPASDGFTSTSALHRPRAFHTASLLPDGSVLVTGGLASSGADGSVVDLGDAERWDPATEQWTTLGDVLPAPRSHHTADVLADGRVMLLGGQDVERGFYSDVLSRSGARTGAPTRFLSSLSDVVARDAHHALHVGTLWRSDDPYAAADNAVAVVDLDTGSVHAATLAHANFLMHAVSGVRIDGDARALLVGVDGTLVDAAHPYGRPSALVLDEGVERATRHAPLCWRDYPTAQTLPDGRVLVAGGLTPDGVASTGELFDPADERFTATCPMVQPRVLAASVVLDDGSVLVVGGVVMNQWGTVAERFVPATR